MLLFSADMKFSDLSRVISFMMFASAVCSSSRGKCMHVFIAPADICMLA